MRFKCHTDKITHVQTEVTAFVWQWVLSCFVDCRNIGVSEGWRSEWPVTFGKELRKWSLELGLRENLMRQSRETKVGEKHVNYMSWWWVCVVWVTWRDYWLPCPEKEGKKCQFLWSSGTVLLLQNSSSYFFLQILGPRNIITLLDSEMSNCVQFISLEYAHILSLSPDNLWRFA